MTHIKTPSGFEADIDEARLDDYRLTKAIRAAQKEPVAIVDVVSFILGKDENRFVEHVAAQNGGRASHDAIEAELGEIFTQLTEGKKKSSCSP